MRFATSFPLALLFALQLAACADARARATFPEDAAHQDFLEEQALLGLDNHGDALAAQLFAAEGAPPVLTLMVFDREGGPTRRLATAPGEVARAVAAQVLRDGERPAALLAAATSSLWPEVVSLADEAGFRPAAPTPPEPGMRRWSITGAGMLPLTLRIAAPSSGPAASLLVLAENPGRSPDSEEVELARMPLAGSEVAPLLWIDHGIAWMLAGSVQPRHGGPIHRAVGLRRGSLARGEAMLHNQHGLADYAAGELDAARREFERALLADPRYVDALYNDASICALEDRPDEAVALLRRAADEDPRRVQVLGRDDDDLRTLRQRPDVRALLGLVRMPPGE